MKLLENTCIDILELPEIYSPIRLANKGFLVYPKAMGGLLPGEFDLGFPGDAALLEPGPPPQRNCFRHSQLSKNCLWRSELSKNALSALDCQKIYSAFFLHICHIMSRVRACQLMCGALAHMHLNSFTICIGSVYPKSQK